MNSEEKNNAAPKSKIIQFPADGQKPESTEKSVPSPEGEARTKALILIIEDETLITTMYSKKLDVDGYDCIIAGNGNEGIKEAKEKLPDLILCDVMMPEKDGISTLKELKGDESTKSIPVIMLSNLADEKYVEQALELGAVSYLIKSNTVPADVVTKVKEVLTASGKVSLLSKAA